MPDPDGTPPDAPASAPIIASEPPLCTTATPGYASPKMRGDVFGWALAFTPLILPVLAFAFEFSGVVVLPSLLSVLVTTITAAIIIADKRVIAAEGRAVVGKFPSTLWFLFPPAYLWKRARAFSLPRLQVWVWIGCSVLSYFLLIAAMAVGVTNTAEAGMLPSCAAPAVTESLLDIFDDLPVMRTAGVRAVSVSRQAEVVVGQRSPRTRDCTASILDQEDDEHGIDYTIEQRPDQVLVHLKLRD